VIFNLFALILVAIHLSLTGPYNLHRLSASVFEEEGLWHIFMSIFSTKINQLKLFFAKEGKTDTLGSESDFLVNTIVDNNMKCILELLSLIRLTDNFNLL